MSVSEKTKYIFSEGEFKRKDNSLAFKTDEGWNYIPVENVNEIYLMNQTTLSTNLLGFLSKNGVSVHFFNYYGYYTGTFYPKEKYISGKLTVEQVKKFISSREEIARSIVMGTANSIVDLLTHYRYHGHEDLSEYFNFLKTTVPTKLDSADSISKIMSIEGEMWQLFYKEFNKILSDQFEFEKRSRRPPENPVNAMISFGNTILYTKTLSQLYFTQLNQEVSFLHEPTEKRFSLALDLSEVFKAPIVYKTILNLANKRQIDPIKHFDKDINYCMLNEDGKKIFVNALEEQFGKTFQHSTLKRHTSYLHAIRLDAYKLSKSIVEDSPFIPFNNKESC